LTRTRFGRRLSRRCVLDRRTTPVTRRSDRDIRSRQRGLEGGQRRRLRVRGCSRRRGRCRGRRRCLLRRRHREGPRIWSGNGGHRHPGRILVRRQLCLLPAPRLGLRPRHIGVGDDWNPHRRGVGIARGESLCRRKARRGHSVEAGRGRDRLRVARDRRDFEGREVEGRRRELPQRRDRVRSGGEGSCDRHDVADREGKGADGNHPQRHTPAPEREEAEAISRK
jgi:hypothetical protein